MIPLASVLLGLIINDEMLKIVVYNTETLEEKCLDVSLGNVSLEMWNSEIWEEQVATQIHRLF